MVDCSLVDGRKSVTIKKGNVQVAEFGRSLLVTSDRSVNLS